MGTKNNPSRFDCYANADPDEPMFVLLGRDRFAASLVDLWSNARSVDGEDVVKISEALECAESMRQWLANLGDESVEVLAHIPYETLAEELRRRGATVTAVPHGGDFKNAGN